jgi:hypothetical protein
MAKVTSKNATATCVTPRRKRSDVEIIRERLAEVMADKELFRQTLIKSGVYDDNLKLTSAYRYR